MNALSQYRGLPRQVYYLCTVRFVADVGLMFVMPFLSLICTQRLGFSTVQTAYIVMVISLGNIAGSLLGGKLADSIGRKRTTLIMDLLVLVIMILAGLNCESRLVLVFMFFGFIANAAMVPAAMAILVDLTDETNRNESISLNYIFCNLGVAFGPFLAGLLFYRHTSWIFYSMALFFGIAFLLTYFCIREPEILDGVTAVEMAKQAREKKETMGETASENAEAGHSLLRVILERPILLTFLIILFLIFLCYTELGYMLPIQFSEWHGVEAASKMTSAMWTVNGVVVVLVTPILVTFMKKHRPLVNMTVGCLIYAVSFSTYAFKVSYVPIMIAAAVWTCGEIMVNTESTVYLAEVAPPSHSGRVMSMFEFCRAGGKVVGPILCSYVIALISYHTLWFAIGGLCLILAAALVALNKADKKRRLAQTEEMPSKEDGTGEVDG